MKCEKVANKIFLFLRWKIKCYWNLFFQILNVDKIQLKNLMSKNIKWSIWAFECWKSQNEMSKIFKWIIWFFKCKNSSKWKLKKLKLIIWAFNIQKMSKKFKDSVERENLNELWSFKMLEKLNWNISALNVEKIKTKCRKIEIEFLIFYL